MILEKNIIKKLTVEIDVPTMEQALRVKDDINGFLKQQLYPKLATLFTDYESTSEIIEWEHLALEIDVSNTNFSSVLSNEIGEKITQQLQQKLTNTKENEAYVPSVRKTPSEKNIEAFIHFLKTGQYPWWKDPSKTLTFPEISTTTPTSIVQLKKTLLSSNAQKRLIYQFDNSFITQLYGLLYLGNESNTISEKDFPKPLQNETIKVAFWGMIFSLEKEAKFKQFESVFISFIADSFGDQTRRISEDSFTVQENKCLAIEQITLLCQQHLKLPIQWETDALGHFQLVENSKPKNVRLSKENNLIFKLGPVKINTSEKQSATSIIQEFPREKHSENEVDKIISGKEGFIVQNAGLIILHPFLKKFFEKHGFVHENNILEDNISEAVHLLHFLATGNEKAPEQQLVFEKYLCGIPFHKPIKKEVIINSSQKAAAEELLAAILQHWNSLKTNNIDVLRNEFLQREGKIQHKSERHQLFIERKTQDILLESIPWNIHLIKLPWQNQLLFVEW